MNEQTEAAGTQAASQQTEAAIALPNEALPEIVRPIYRAVIEAMQITEELAGYMDEDVYVGFMCTLAGESLRRARLVGGPEVPDPFAAATVSSDEYNMLRDVLVELDASERLPGPFGPDNYLALVYAVAAEAACRAANCTESHLLPAAAEAGERKGLEAAIETLRSHEASLGRLRDEHARSGMARATS